MKDDVVGLVVPVDHAREVSRKLSLEFGNQFVQSWERRDLSTSQCFLKYRKRNLLLDGSRIEKEVGG